jgi:1-acyl-sn-glycerol-3-phosphate acyltransferase
MPVIPAHKTPWIDALIYALVKRALRRSFHRIRVRGLEHWRLLDPKIPVLAVANHTNWWDLWLIHRLTRECPHKQVYGMMEEANLQHHRFLTRIGAFGVDLTDRRKAAQGLRHALTLLASPETVVWIFPQGKLTRPEVALELKPGADFLARQAPGVNVLPVAFRYGFDRESRPEIWIDFSPPLSLKSEEGDTLASALGDRLAALDESLSRSDWSGFTDLQSPGLTINKKWEYVCRFFAGTLRDFRSEN